MKALEFYIGELALADLVARSHCEYLAMGIEWKKAISMALFDNRIWSREIKASGDDVGRIISYSILERCPNLNAEAFKKYQRSPGSRGV